ncbi:MAG: sigma-54-dependent Fis family transcriptional regulator [Deltaproteobacteria bacterium]|nr:sigma-54-dependent Fis family transcriptional regulator [Deltaproteobacteria bacterium]
MKTRALWVEDDADFRELVSMWLESFGLEVEALDSAEAALPILDAGEVDLVLADLNLANMSGLDLCAHAATHAPGVPVIVLTAFGSVEAAIGAIRAGAYDFVTKPCDKAHLKVVVDRAVNHRTLQVKVRRLSEALRRTEPLDDIIGDSAAMKRLQDTLTRVAGTDATVLIQGESGTGKELVARALHRNSLRADGPFVAVNCAALPAALLESELFGHVAGAFTDAKESRVGLIREAEGGTLFLDEIGEMPLEMQVKLLRAIQERTLRPVGAHREVPFDVRLVTATNRDLEAEVEAGRFREDLFYRVNVVRLETPPLRARDNDVLLLAQAFIEKSSERLKKRVTGLDAKAAQCLAAYAWPGNVRELENCIEGAVALARYETLSVDDLPERVRKYQPRSFAVSTNNPAELPSLAEMERRYILKVLEAVGDNKSAAARILGVDRRTLYRKLDAMEAGEDEAES